MTQINYNPDGTVRNVIGDTTSPHAQQYLQSQNVPPSAYATPPTGSAPSGQPAPGGQGISPTVPPEYATLGITPQQYAQLQTPQGMDPVSFNSLIGNIQTKMETNNTLMQQRQLLMTHLFDTPLSPDMMSKLPTDLQQIVQSGDKSSIEFALRNINDDIAGRTNTLNQSINYVVKGYEDAISLAESQKTNAQKTIEDALTRSGSLAFANYPDAMKRQLEQAAGYPSGYLDNVQPTITERRFAAEYGAGSGSGSGVGGTQFTKTQVNKGVVNTGIGTTVAPMTIQDFKNLDPDTQNFFVNNKTAIDSIVGEIDSAATDPNTDWAQLTKDINDSELLPQEAKDRLIQYLEDKKPTDTQAKPQQGGAVWYEPWTWF